METVTSNETASIS